MLLCGPLLRLRLAVCNSRQVTHTPSTTTICRFGRRREEVSGAAGAGRLSARLRCCSSPESEFEERHERFDAVEQADADPVVGASDRHAAAPEPTFKIQTKKRKKKLSTCSALRTARVGCRCDCYMRLRTPGHGTSGPLGPRPSSRCDRVVEHDTLIQGRGQHAGWPARASQLIPP